MADAARSCGGAPGPSLVTLAQLLAVLLVTVAIILVAVWMDHRHRRRPPLH